MRIKESFELEHTDIFYQKMLCWLRQYDIFCVMHSNKLATNQEVIVGVHALHTIQANSYNQATLLSLQHTGDWLMGHVNYPTSSAQHQPSNASENIGFTAIHFFVPQIVLILNGDTVYLECMGIPPLQVFKDIMHTATQAVAPHNAIAITPIQSKQAYINAINTLKQHIQLGDCYEINYCTTFEANYVQLSPIHAFNKLNAISPNPYAVLYKVNDDYAICASPERFFKLQGNILTSQPIKGTILRDNLHSDNDAKLVAQLKTSPKENAENVMVVDLVRNDMSKVCIPNTVQVTELSKVYSFTHLHHLISTIQGVVKPGTAIADIFAALYPMGSMTGAPKTKVMQLIQQYETHSRGIFSGTIGYINPQGNADFNVVIRSIQYNAALQYLNYKVGSGITTYCHAATEYEECMLKAKAIQEVLSTSL